MERLGFFLLFIILTGIPCSSKIYEACIFFSRLTWRRFSFIKTNKGPRTEFLGGQDWRAIEGLRGRTPKSSNRILLQDRFVKTKLQEENEETIFQKYAIIEQQSEKDFSDLVSAWTTWIARVTFHNNI